MAPAYVFWRGGFQPSNQRSWLAKTLDPNHEHSLCNGSFHPHHSPEAHPLLASAGPLYGPGSNGPGPVGVLQSGTLWTTVPSITIYGLRCCTLGPRAWLCMEWGLVLNGLRASCYMSQGVALHRPGVGVFHDPGMLLHGLGLAFCGPGIMLYGLGGTLCGPGLTVYGPRGYSPMHIACPMRMMGWGLSHFLFPPPPSLPQPGLAQLRKAHGQGERGVGNSPSTPAPIRQPPYATPISSMLWGGNRSRPGALCVCVSVPGLFPSPPPLPPRPVILAM